MSENKIHPETGEKLVRDVRPFIVRYGGRERVIQLPGCGEGLHARADMAIVDRTLVELKLRISLE